MSNSGEAPPHQQHQVTTLSTLQFHPSETANHSLLHFHQQILLVKEGNNPTLVYTRSCWPATTQDSATFIFSTMYSFISLHLGTIQSVSSQPFEWWSRSFHMKTHLLQPAWLRVRISHRTPWKNSFFKVKQTWRVQLRGLKHLDACTRHST